MERNPWTGISDWREFLYDARHPLQFFRRGWAGLRGRNDVAPLIRWCSVGIVIEGLALMLMGLFLIVRGMV